MSTSLYSNTPAVTVLDNRGLTVRDIAYHRHPDSPDVTSVRITRHHHDARGFLTQSAGPRLAKAGLANFTWLPDLAGSVLRTVSADAGTTVALNDAAGRPFIAVSNISTGEDGADDRSQAVTRTWQYEDAELPGRPLSITEQVSGEAARVTERFVWAGNSDAEKAVNLAGECVSHYDTAGTTQTGSVALTGIPLSVTRRLLKDADNPDVMADWQGEDASAWNDLLDGEAYATLSTADATGAVLTTTDAKGNVQRLAYDVAGLLSGSWLTLKDGAEQVIVASLTYSAAGQKLREAHGNGVVTTYTYEAETQRLTGITTERPAGHAAGAKVLQDLRYEYDPVGNVLKITSDAEATRFWRNQEVVPENTYVYDSLYQLVSATGREMAGAGQQGSNLPATAVPLPGDSSAYTNYTRTYSYDNAGNLTQIRHSAPATNNSYTTNITVSDKSNRGVLSTLTENPADVDALFTAGGQQAQLQPGQNLVWTPRNELLKVTPVVRAGGTDDRESYRYDGGSQRILKVSVQKTGNSTQTQRALYLPGLELRSTKSGDTETEGLQAITVGGAGRAQVRVLHWESGRPAEITGDQVRYSHDNLTGSSGLELDGDGNVISMEEYYPYGGTALWTARSAVEADYKTVRYSGKERDATGLYYYGYRYYQPWAGRWLSADPAGTVDGLNLFRMVQNNPVTLVDKKGLSPANGNNYLHNTSIKMSGKATRSKGQSANVGCTLCTLSSCAAGLNNMRLINNRLATIKTRGKEDDNATVSKESKPKNYPIIRFQTPDEVQLAPLSSAPEQIWHSVEMEKPGWDTQYVFGANREIFSEHLIEPLTILARRNSITKRPINIISGSHGVEDGLNWAFDGKVPVRRPEILEHQFIEEDIDTVEKIEAGTLSELSSLKGRVNVIDLAEIDGPNYLQNYLNNPSNHVILAHCFGRNDAILRKYRNLNAVISYIDDEDFEKAA